ncbi:MAG: hypothetical protein WEB53_12185 [Akkermansiaceae bacterium]
MKTISISILLAATAAAHPTAFEGAYQLMFGTAGDVQNLEFYSSYSARAAWGLHAMRFEDEEDEIFTGLQHNWLLKRWNLPSAQANVYAGLGAGMAGEVDNGAAPAGIGFFRADYETRRIYAAFDAKWVESDDVSRGVFSAAAGIAPYKAEFDQLNTWLILQAEHVTGMEDELDIIPKVRFFRGPYFLELGSTLRGKPIINFMIHF